MTARVCHVRHLGAPGGEVEKAQSPAHVRHLGAPGGEVEKAQSPAHVRHLGAPGGGSKEGIGIGPGKECTGVQGKLCLQTNN